MRKVELPIYDYSELSDEVKNRLRNDYRDEDHVSWIYEDAIRTIERFNVIFSVKNFHGNLLHWLSIDVPSQVLALEGERLRRYIWNNYFRELYKGKYRPMKTSGKKVYHPCVKCTEYKNGRISNEFRSRMFFTNDCVLTGMCYDMDMLGPIYKFLDSRPDEIEHVKLTDLINQCYESMEKALENEKEYMATDEYIDEEIANRSKMYFKNGDVFHDDKYEVE